MEEYEANIDFLDVLDYFHFNPPEDSEPFSIPSPRSLSPLRHNVTQEEDGKGVK
jgi:hypothetical protein